MFIAALKIMPMKKDCWMILLCFGIMVELGNWKVYLKLGKERDASDNHRNAHQRGCLKQGRSFYRNHHIHPKVSWNRIKLTCIPLFMGYHFRKSRKKVGF